MAIGDRIAGRSPAKQYSQQRPVAGAFGEGVATAITQLSGAFDDLDTAYESISLATTQRREKEEDFNAEKQYIEFIGQQNRQQAERIRNTSESAAGITDQTNEAVRASSQEFLSTLPERLRQEYDNKITAYREQTVTSAFNYEYTAGNQKFVKDVNDVMNSEASEVLLGNKSAEDAFETVQGLIARSDLDEAAQRDLRDQSRAFLLRAEFQKEVEYARDFRGTVAPRTEGDVVAAGLMPHERGILNAISDPESSDRYDVIYGGEKITDFSDHPRKYVEITTGPNKGKKSSAAGKYQFLASTWDSTVDDYNRQNPQAPIRDFSPESQDRIALFYARKIYNRQLGAGERTFDQVLQSGDRDLIISMKRALWDDKGGWEGFRHMSDNAFANIIMGSKGIRGGGTGTPQDPDIWNNPRYASLTFDQKNTLANSAEVSSSQRDAAAAKQLLAQQAAVVEETMMNAIQGKHTRADMGQLIEQGKLRDSSDVNKWQGLVDEAQKGQAERARITASLNNGTQLFPGEDNKGLNNYIGREGLDAVRSMDTDFAQQQLLPVTAVAGFIPSDTATLLSDMAAGTNTSQREYALGVLTAAASADPTILDRSAGISEGVKKQVVLANQLRGVYTAEEIATRLRDMNDPRQATVIEAARKEANKLYSENVETDNILQAFDGWMPNDEPAAPIDRGQEARLRQDHMTAYAEGYLLTNDPDEAMEYANTLIKRNWQTTNVGGSKRLTKFPPEIFYSTIGGSHDWIDAQARDELGFGEDVEFQLIPDAQTEAEGKRYLSAADKTGLNNASYQVVFVNEQGYPDIMRGEDGAPIRWGAAVTPEMRQRMETASEYSNLTARRSALTMQFANNPMDEANAAELREIGNKIEELESNDPHGDPGKVVVPTRKSDLLSQRDELQKKYDAAMSGTMPGSRQVQAPKLKRQLDEINKQLENF